MDGKEPWTLFWNSDGFWAREPPPCGIAMLAGPQGKLKVLRDTRVRTEAVDASVIYGLLTKYTGHIFTALLSSAQSNRFSAETAVSHNLTISPVQVTYLRNSPSVSQVGTNLWQQMVPCPTNLQHHCNCVALCVAELLLLGLDLIIGQKPNFCSRNTLLSKLLVWRGASLSWLLLTKDRDWLGSWWINAAFVCRILGWTISTIVMSQNSSASLQFFKTFFMLRWLSWALPFVP